MLGVECGRIPESCCGQLHKKEKWLFSYDNIESSLEQETLVERKSSLSL